MSAICGSSTEISPGAGSLDEALDFQRQILPEVSRTFALTIPQLPSGLREAVVNAYLLCRIADTIEDEPELPPEAKALFHERFVAAIDGLYPPAELASKLAPRLSGSTLASEKRLVENIDQVLRCTFELAPGQRRAMRDCVAIMCRGMGQYQRTTTLNGLDDQSDMDRYCYFVAGVVGEMLTELFASHSPEIAARRPQLMALATSFGQGLQMTNILKDVWDDRQRGVCWWPRDVFEQEGISLLSLQAGRSDSSYRRALDRLIGVAHGHLDNALRYAQLIPRNEVGIRRFCVWAVGLALMTLKNIHRRPEYQDGQDVKVSRRQVKQFIATTSVAVRSNAMIRGMCGWIARGLPVSAVDGAALPSDWPQAANVR